MDSNEKKKFVNDLLARPLIARMATTDPKGQPHVVPVWYGWDGTSIWISSFSNTRKIKDLLQNPKISIAIDRVDEEGKSKAVIFEGSVTLVQAPRDFLHKQFTWIYTRYLGEEGVKEKEPQSWINDPQNLLIKLTPEQVFTWDHDYT